VSRDFKIGMKITSKDAATKKFRSIARVVRGDLKRSFRSAGRAAKKLGRGIGRAAKRVGMLGAAAVGAAAYGVTKLITSSAKAGDEIAKNSKRTGLAAQTYAELRYAAELAGAEQKQFAKAMEVGTRNLGDLAAGQGTLNLFLKRTAPEFRKQLLALDNQEDRIMLLIEGMSELKDESARAAFAQAAFGRGGQAISLIAEKGTGVLREQMAQYAKYNKITPEYLRGAEQFVDAQTEVKTAIEGVKTSIASKLLPALTPLLKQFAEWFSKSENVERVSREVAEALKSVAEWLANIKWKEVWKGLKEAVGFIKDILAKMWEWRKVIIIIAGATALLKVVAVITKAVMFVKKLGAGFKAAKVEAVATAAASERTAAANRAGAAGAGGRGGRGGGLLGAAGRAAGAFGLAYAASEALTTEESGIADVIVGGFAAADMKNKVQARKFMDWFEAQQADAWTASLMSGMDKVRAMQAAVPVFGGGFISGALGDEIGEKSTPVVQTQAKQMFETKTLNEEGLVQAKLSNKALEKIAAAMKDQKTDVKLSLDMTVKSDPGTKAELASQPTTSTKATGGARTSLGSATVRSGSSV
jgi:hypothetical protein